MTQYFQLQEFECPCCKYQDMEQELLNILEKVREDWDKPMIIDSGYRCQMHNYAIGGAPSSSHMFGEAVDIKDPDGTFTVWIVPKLETYGLWMESPIVTVGWVHLQTRECKNRVFIP